MIVLLDTSTPTCKVTLVGEQTRHYEWEAGRELAKGLLAYLEQKLHEREVGWSDVEGLGVFRGPGSFTGLRIGMTVMNTLAQSLSIPIIGTVGDEWESIALERLEAGENDQLVLPEYGAEATITSPKK